MHVTPSPSRTTPARRHIFCLLAALAFAAASGVAGEKDKNPARDFQGTWQAVDLEANGEKSPADQVRELKIVFRGDEVYAVKPQGEDPKNKFKLIPATNPKGIDVIPVDGDHKGRTHAGIYALQDGRLRLCINLFGQDPSQRPCEFKTKGGDGVIFVTLERSQSK